MAVAIQEPSLLFVSCPLTSSFVLLAICEAPLLAPAHLHTR
jgi:hypothetical protein